MITYNLLATTIKNLLYTPAGSLNTKKSDMIDLMLVTALELPDRFVKDNIRYVTKKLHDDIILIDVRCDYDAADKYPIKVSTSVASFYDGVLYLVHAASSDNTHYTYLKGALQFIKLCVEHVMIPKACEKINRYAPMVILTNVVIGTSMLTEMEHDESKLLENVIFDDIDDVDMHDKFKRAMKDRVMEDEDFVSILLDKNTIVLL